MKSTLENTTLEVRYAAFVSLPVGWERPVEDFIPGARCRVELDVITNGCYRLESADGSVHEIHEGSLFMDRLMDRKFSSNGSDQPLEFISIRFAVYNRAGHEITFHFDQPFPIVYGNPAQRLFIRQTAETAVRFYHHNQPLAAAHCLSTILYLTQFSAHEESTHSLEKKTHIRQIAGEMEDYLGNKLVIGELAQRLGYSRTYFSKLFKEIMGVSPKEYLCTKRIEQAKDLLHGTALSVAEIARATGYGDDLTFFYRHFKQRTGMSPGAYRTKSQS
ncbi:MAG: AraC family transcriptional regulator [Kiritimatiellales bacterium]|nr:AraC family transcriptional regulator [Kiritimatiellales bacterium]MCF7863479.1 AraC family transcriptional regulator [Kiritimatiellales bacterium]